MKSKDLKFGDKARERMLAGVSQLADAVQSTLGPRGRNVVIELEQGDPLVTKDGVTVAKHINLEDPFEDMGAQLVKQVASKTCDEAGDGTTTATVLARSILVKGYKALAAGMNPMDLKRGLDLGLKTVLESIKEQSIPCTDSQSIVQVGTISANSDLEIGELIAEAIAKVGQEGVITVTEGTSIHNELEIVEGMQYDAGYASPYFVTDPKSGNVVLENPFILLVNHKIVNIRELLPILEAVSKTGRPILLVSDDIDDEALSALVINNARGVVKAAVAKAPGLGDMRTNLMEDIAILTGTTVLKEAGKHISEISLEDLGDAAKVEITKDKTTIINGQGKPEEIATRIKNIEEQLEKETEEYEQIVLKLRKAKLSSGVALIKVGGATEVEMKEKKDRVDDALSATQAAIEEGIVPGGGLALVKSIATLNAVKGKNDDQNVGLTILKESLESPIRQIAENSGVEGSTILGELKHNKGKSIGYDAYTGKYVDMFKEGIIDPAKVTRTALQSAVSVAGLMLTTECMISFKKDEENS